MADQQIPGAPASDDVQQSSGSVGLIARLVVAGFVSTVIVAESVVAYLLIPSAADTAAMAQARLNKDIDSVDGEKEEESEDDTAPITEVELGDFSVSAYQSVSNTTLRIDFRLFGVVLEEDESEFLLRLAKNEHRFREQVIITLRSSEITDLTDPSVGLIKRKILEKTNRSFGKPLLRGIVFSDFSFIEQ